MTRFLTYIFIVTAAMLMTAGCNGGRSKQGPAEVVEAFTQAVAGGRFEEAEGFCGKGAASDYINAYKKALSSEFKADSTAASIAAGIMSEIKVTVTRISKGKGYRTVFYTIEDAYGDRKDKVATVMNEEGEWKVTEIKDRN